MRRKEVSADDIEIVKCWDFADRYFYLFKVKGDMMAESIDRKFKIDAHSFKSKKSYSHNNAVLFIASDKLLPDLLDEYKALCSKHGADERQILAVDLLKERVLLWQRENMDKVKLPDVDVGEEEQRVCRKNNT